MEGYAAEWNGFIWISALLPLALLAAVGMRMKPDYGPLRKQAIVFSAACALLIITEPGE